MSSKYDVIVIGGGPGGYVSAIRAAQLGLKTAIVEKRGVLGGTCLNVGCIPSKTMLQSSHHYEMADKEFGSHGINISGLKLDLKTMLGRKDKVVDDLTKGIGFLIKKNKIDYHIGTGIITEPGNVSVATTKTAQKKILKTSNIIVATGSETSHLTGLPIDEKLVLSSTGALSLSAVPKSMAVIGAGVIGLELGSVWRRLGAQVTVIEYLDTLLPGMDLEISKSMERILKKQGLTFRLGFSVTAGKTKRTGVTLEMHPRDGGSHETLKTDVVLVAVGRRPFIDGLGLEKLSVNLDDRGFISVDKHYQTNIKGIYAIGDVIGGPMLAHKAEDEGVICAEIIAGESGHINYDCIPNIVYTRYVTCAYRSPTLCHKP